MAIEVAVKLTDYDFLSMTLFRLVLFADQVFSYDLGIGVFVGAVDCGDAMLVLEIGRPSGSVAAFFCGFLLSFYVEFANFVKTATDLYIIVSGCQTSIEEHVLVFYYLFRWVLMERVMSIA